MRNRIRLRQKLPLFGFQPTVTSIFGLLAAMCALFFIADCSMGESYTESGFVVEKAYEPSKTTYDSDGDLVTTSTQRILIIVGLRSDEVYEINSNRGIYATTSTNDTVRVDSRVGRMTGHHYFSKVIRGALR